MSYLNESGVYSERMTVTRADNATIYLQLSDGKVKPYSDFMSAYGSVNFGHCNPEIKPFDDYASDIVACFYPEEAELFSDWLCGKLALPEHKVLFQVGGSLAVSTALSMAQRIRPGKIAAMKGSFHGLGLDSLSITSVQKDLAIQNTPLLHGMQQQVVFLEPGEMPERWDELSCVIYEPVQGANGYVPLDPEWLARLEQEAKANGVLTIADEIQCGYYRHGWLSPARSRGLNPDMLLYSKSMTNGLYPFSAVVYPEAFDREFEMPVALAHTFQNSALGCLAAYRTAQYLDASDLEEQIRQMSLQLSDLASKLENAYVATDVYSMGPSLSFGLPDDGARKLVQQCLKEGILIFTGGITGQRVRVAPPITMPAEQLKRGLQVIEDLLLK